MRIAIATENEQVAQHFGRCPGFTIVDIDKDGKIISKTFVENPGHKAHQPGQVPMFLRKQNTDCVIAGGMGPNAIMNLQAHGIKVITGITGKLDDVIAQFLSGNLKSGESLCDHSHESCGH